MKYITPGNPGTPISPGNPRLGNGGKGFMPDSPFDPFYKYIFKITYTFYFCSSILFNYLKYCYI